MAATPAPATVRRYVAGIAVAHSTRVGAAQDMIAAGIDMPAILHAGRWKFPAMVNRYGERLLARNRAPRSSPGCSSGVHDGVAAELACPENSVLW